MVIFRKLTFETSRQFAEAEATQSVAQRKASRKYAPGFLPALARIDTQPVAFFVFDNVLVTVRPSPSRTIEQVRQRLLESCGAPRPASARRRHGGAGAWRQAANPARRPDAATAERDGRPLLGSACPLTRQLDRWQRALLSSRHSFSSWEGLLDARIQLRRLEHLSEEQRDALQEFRDSLLDNRYSAEDAEAQEASRDEVLLVRINDLMEHILRVLAHARRLEDSIESAVQIHFSAVAHRTNRTMRALTVITAVFMPLTLITGIFGMNFARMPWLQEPDGFWWSIGLMGAVVAVIGGVWGLGRWLDR
jgi:Mg2+ and Co2+ transporter CorA